MKFWESFERVMDKELDKHPERSGIMAVGLVIAIIVLGVIFPLFRILILFMLLLSPFVWISSLFIKAVLDSIEGDK